MIFCFRYSCSEEMRKIKNRKDVPSRDGLAFLIQSVKCRTKSKKKSPSGTEITLSAILTNRLKPSADRRLSLCAIFWQKSFALVDESTSNAYKSKSQ